jgi:hypothetical protein
MKKEGDDIKEAPPKEESKTHKYMRIALCCLLIAFMVLMFYRILANKLGW